MAYIVITPLKNEENYFRFIADSMILQSLRPSIWIIVDDGSTDSSAMLIQEYARLYEWIIYLKFKDKKEKRSYGAKVVRAFNYGLKG